MTRLEWLLLIAIIISVFAAIIFAARTRQRATGRPIWEGDNNERYPMPVPRVNEASMGSTNSPSTFRQIMSGVAGTPEVVYLQQTEKARLTASNSAFLCNSNISYFIDQDDVTLADGSVKQEGTTGLGERIAYTGVVSNRVQMSRLEP